MNQGGRTFSYRSLIIGVVGMIVMALWVDFHTILLKPYLPLAQGSPPLAAVGVFVGILIIGGLLALISSKFRLAKGELVVIYAMLIIAAPLFTHGMWQRFVGLLVAIPRAEELLVPLGDGYPDTLWPHGEHLVENRRFEDGETDNVSFTPFASGRIIELDPNHTPMQCANAAELHNPAAADGKDSKERTKLRITIPRFHNGKEIVVPGEAFHMKAFVRVTGLGSESSFSVELVPDHGEASPIRTISKNSMFGYRRPGKYVLEVTDVMDWLGFVMALRGEDPDSAYAKGRPSPAARIMSQISPELSDSIRGAYLNEPISAGLKQRTVEALREVLASEDFFDVKYFPKRAISLKGGIWQQLDRCKELPPRKVLQLNRKLFTQSFVGLVAPVAGFERVAMNFLQIPRGVENEVYLDFILVGAGTVAVTDVVFFNNQALWSLHKGREVISQSEFEKLPLNARDNLLVRPDNMASPEGVMYHVKGVIPYGQWLGPMLYWGSIVIAMFACLFGIAVIFRKQWADNERFSFPLLILPRMLLEEGEEDGKFFRPILRNPAFKAGIVFALFITAMQGAAFYVPGLPNPVINLDMRQFTQSQDWGWFIRGEGEATFAVRWHYVAISFFMEIDMLFSIVLFAWIIKIPYYFGSRFGWRPATLDKFPYMHEQGIGSYLTVAVLTVWISRRHLVGVFRRVLGMAGGADDSGEAISYRKAVLLVIASFVFFGLWGWKSGTGAGSSILIFGFLIVCGFVAARIRSEAGLPWTYFTPYSPHLLFVVFGSLFVFSLETMVLLFVAGGFMAVAQFLMFAPSQVELLQLAKTSNSKPRGVSKGMLIGLIGGYVLLRWAHSRGSENIEMMKNFIVNQDISFQEIRRDVKSVMDNRIAKEGDTGIEEPRKSYTGERIGIGVGATVTAVLTFLRMRFVGFRLHPLGYVLGNSYFSSHIWGSMLVALIIKWVALKIGGPRVIREKMTPFFGGVFIGAIAGIVIWDAVAGVLMSQGITKVFSCWP